MSAGTTLSAFARQAGFGHFPDTRIVELPSLLITPIPGVKLKVIAVGDGHMRCRLLEPG